MAFLFDIDGVLISSHEAQVSALTAAMDTIAHEQRLPTTDGHRVTYQTSEVESNLLKLIQGSTEQRSMAAVLAAYEEFRPFAQQLFASAWSTYYQTLERDQTWHIKTSVSVLNALHDLGYHVCLVSNSKKVDVERYCRLLRLDHILARQAFVCSEDVQDHPKPSPVPYQLAASKLNVPSHKCVVVEDSSIGVASAKAAGMYVVGFHRLPSLPLPTGANEVVDSLTKASVLRKVAYPTTDIQWHEHTVRVRVVTVQTLDNGQRNSLVQQTYDVYLKLFQGRTVETWRSRICDAEDLLTRLGLFFDAESRLSGYAVLKIRPVTFRGEPRLVSLVSAGVLDTIRGSAAVERFYQVEWRRACFAWPTMRHHVIDNFLSYPGYSLGPRCFRRFTPSFGEPQPDVDTLEYMRFLASHVGYKKAVVPHPLVYISSSSVEPPSKEMLAIMTRDPHGKFFLQERGIGRGHGLLTLAEISLENLQPVSAAARKRAKL